MTAPDPILAELAAIWPGEWRRDGDDWLCRRPYARVQRLSGLRLLGIVSAAPHLGARVWGQVNANPAIALQAAADTLRERVRQLAEKVGLKVEGP